jgi:hypothetical protein
MIFLAKNFSYKSAFVGFIVGASIGLGMLNFSAFFEIGFVMAAIFGFRGSFTKSPITQKVPDDL